MPIITTPGSASANSYGSLSEATTYFSTQHPIPEKWVLAQSFERENALLTAALDLDELDFIGDRATTTQSLAWPRVINDTYELIRDEFPFADNEIPLKLKYAQFEIALSKLATTSVDVSEGYPIKSWKVGALETTYDTAAGVVNTSTDYSGLPMAAARHLRGLRIPAVLA